MQRRDYMLAEGRSRSTLAVWNESPDRA